MPYLSWRQRSMSYSGLSVLALALDTICRTVQRRSDQLVFAQCECQLERASIRMICFPDAHIAGLF